MTIFYEKLFVFAITSISILILTVSMYSIISNLSNGLTIDTLISFIFAILQISSLLLVISTHPKNIARLKQNMFRFLGIVFMLSGLVGMLINKESAAIYTINIAIGIGFFSNRQRMKS